MKRYTISSHYKSDSTIFVGVASYECYQSSLYFFGAWSRWICNIKSVEERLRLGQQVAEGAL